MKTISSPILFKQIIGRGTRIDPDSGKLWFRIIDYTNATRLLDPKWDKPPNASAPVSDVRPQTASLAGTVRLHKTGDRLVGASVAVITGPNDQRGPILTDDDGRYRFDNLPPDVLTLEASGPRLARRQMKVQTVENEITIVNIDLKRAQERKPEKIVVRGLAVTIADEATFVVAGMDEPMSLEQYLDYTRAKIAGFVPTWNKLRAIWQDPEQRAIFVQQLERASIHVDVLAQVLEQQEVDQLDLLAHLAYDRPLRTRRERADQFRNREEDWLWDQADGAREVILALVDKYVLGGITEMTDPAIFRVSPFREMGEARGVLGRFGGDPQRFVDAMAELQNRLYAA